MWKKGDFCFCDQHPKKVKGRDEHSDRTIEKEGKIIVFGNQIAVQFT
jgi:hypothetical protein